MKEWFADWAPVIGLFLGIIAFFVLICGFPAIAQFSYKDGANHYRNSPARAWELYRESRDLEFKRHNEALGAK